MKGEINNQQAFFAVDNLRYLNKAMLDVMLGTIRSNDHIWTIKLSLVKYECFNIKINSLNIHACVYVFLY